MEEFIGKNFWAFFNTMPEWRRKKTLSKMDGDAATLLVTNQDTNEQYKVVCKCESHYIHTYGFVTDSYLEYGEIISITKI